MTETPVGLYYSSVVYSDSVRIAFLAVALNDLDILEFEISNPYMNAPCRERIQFVAGMECGKILEGKVMKLVRAFYGLKISGAGWRNISKDHIVIVLGFTPSTIDLYMYYQRNTRQDGNAYYDILLVYVDNLLA